MTTVCLYLAVTPLSTMVFGQVGRVHAELSSAAFVATSELSSTAGRVGTKFEVKYRWPSEFRIKTLNPTTGKAVRDRTVERNRIVDYDPSLWQYISTPRKTGDSLGKTVASLDEEMDDLLLAFAAPEGIEVWLTDMVKLAPWAVSSNAKARTLNYKKGDKKITIGIERGSGRIASVDIATGVQRLKWALSYAKSVSGVAFQPPQGAFRVPVFDREMKQPKYADATSRKIAEKMFAAYDELDSVGFDVRRQSGTTKVRMIGNLLRQDDDIATWTYDGRRLTMHNKRTNKWYAGDLNFRGVLDAVATQGTRVDPTARLLMTGFNPYRKRLGDGSTIKEVGSMALDGTTVTILECESDNALITLFVRPDGLVASSSTVAKSAGSEEETVDLRYSYFEVPRSAASGLRLKVPVDQRPVTLKPVAN